ncbi:MAG: autotransporter domain-containing protein [Pseudomonadota bacterium]
MNRVYRVLWSQSRQAFVVTHEKAKTRGKPCSTRKAVALAVVLALGAMVTVPASAATSCLGGGSPISITGPETSTCSLATGDALTVTSTGTISGADPAVAVDGTDATSIDNSGTLSGNTWGIDVYHGGSVTGAITNSNAISGGNFGIHIVTGSSVGSIANNAGGSIAGVGGIGLFTSSSVTGGISNSGAISGLSYGIGLNSSSLTGGIVNSGTISGGRGIYLVNGSSVDDINNAGGSISAAVGVHLVGSSSVTGGIVNSGLITASTGIRLSSASTAGSISNSGTITASSAGIRLSSGSTVGSITNSGTIFGAYYGLHLSRSSSVTGAITNEATGTISNSGGSGAVILLSSGSSVGSIVNDGTISGGRAGIQLQANSGGSPTGGSGPSSVTGDITNTGTISGSSAGIALDSGSSVGGSIVNSGTIAGNNAAISIRDGSSIDGSITNEVSGSIIGRTASASWTGSGIYVSSSSIDGSIVNSGTIAGGVYLNNGSSVAGDITNNAGGSISRSSSAALWLYASTVGSITNDGTISSSNGHGIWLAGATTPGLGVVPSSVTGSISNSGTIAGGENGICLSNSTAGGIVNSGNITGWNGAVLISNSSVGSITNDVGGTISSSGQTGLRLQNGSTVSGDITNNGTIAGANTGLFISDSSSVTGNVVNSGTINGGSYAIYVSSSSTVGGIANTGTINGAVELGGTTLNLNGAAGSISGPVTGGAGSVVNVNGTFTTADTFAVDTFSIAGTGRLNMGHDITPDTSFNNAGTLAVAAATTVTITGDYTQTSTGTFQTGVTDDTNYGKLVVTGTATLPTGAMIYVNVADPDFAFTATSLSDVISAGTLVSDGTFAVDDNSALFDFTASKNGNAVDLALASPGAGGSTVLVNAVNSTGNTSGLGAATVLDGLAAAYAGGGTGNADMDRVMAALATLTTNQQLSDAVTRMLPLMTGALTRFTFANLREVNRVVRARLETNRGLSSGDDFAGNRMVWLKPLGSWAEQEDRNGASGYDAQTYGMVLGADGELSEISRIGAAFAYTRSDVDSNSGAQSADVDSYLAVLYGSRSLDENTDLNWQADYAYNRNQGDRYISLMDRTARSSYHSDSFHVGAGVGRTLPVNARTSFTPSFRVDYTTIKENGYAETGAGALNLAVDARTTDELILAVDGKLAHALSDATTLNANLGVGYDTEAEQASLTTSFAGGAAAFTTDGIKPSSTVWRGGLGMVLNASDAMEFTARYDLETRSGYTGQTVSVKFRMPF